MPAVLHHALLYTVRKVNDASENKWRCTMELFTDMLPKRFKIQPMPLLAFSDVRLYEKEKAKSMVEYHQLRAVLIQTFKDVTQNITRTRRQTQKVYDTHSEIVPVNFRLTDYVLKKGTEDQRRTFRTG